MIAARQIAFGRGAGKRKPYDAEIEYLESTGTQYIITDYIPNDNSVAELDFQKVGDNPSLMGVYSASTRFNLGISTSSYNWFGGIGSANTSATTAVSDENRHTLTLSAPEKILRVSGVGEYSCGSGSIAGGTARFNLFARNYLGNDGVNLLPARLYGVKFKENGVLVRDLIPVHKGNIGYMYDRVSGKLFGNQGTGEFVLGPDIIDYTAKDYIQDGLVAVWDGIENAGWGVHDANATVWKDLVGNIDLPLTGYGEFSEQYLHGLSPIRGRWSVEANVDSLSDVFAKGEFSFGGIVNTSSVCPNYGSAHRFVSDAYKGYENVRNGVSPFTEVKNRIQIYVGGAQTNTLGAYYTNDAHQIFYVADGSSLKVYVDGNADVTDRISDEVITKLLLDGASDYGNLFVYSRALTAEEIAHNYSIDKARFGI